MLLVTAPSGVYSLCIECSEQATQSHIVTILTFLTSQQNFSFALGSHIASNLVFSEGVSAD